MRMFDIRDSWLDLDGKPLVGRVKFCKLHTTELENVYNYQGTALSNPIFTNTIGQLVNQVFLQDRTDYTIIFEKYVGDGDMTEDQDNWLFQYSCDNLWNTYGINVDSTTFQLVNNISDLRQLDPQTVTVRDNREVVILGGYDVIGDKPQVMYVWNPVSIDNDNGGSIIKVNNIATGRWELVNTFGDAGVDVRHFGVFGTDSRQDTADTMSLRISLANDYASSIGLPLYFPAIDGLTWYKMNGLNISGAKFARDTRVFGNTGTNTTITVYDEETYLSVFDNNDNAAIFTITGPIVKTSWGGYSNRCIFDPTYRLVIDAFINTYNRSFSNIIVDFYTGVGNLTLDNCQINSFGKIYDGCTFKNCRLTESMFGPDVDFSTITVYDDDIILLSDWPTTSKWLTLRQQNTFGPIDFEGRTVDGTCTLNWVSAEIMEYSNAVFAGFEIKQPNVKLVNTSGNVKLATNINDLTLQDCDIEFDMTGSTVPGTFYMNRSTVTFGKNVTFGNFYSDFSTVNDDGFTHYASAIIVDFSILNSSFSTNGQTKIQNSTFYGNIVTGPVGVEFRNNNFYGQHRINVISADTVVANCIWTGNVGYVVNPIYFNLSGAGTLAADENLHTYTYMNNTGTFAPVTARSVIYKDGSNIMNTHSGSYELVDYGKIQFYIKDNKDIIIAQPYVESKNIDIFHIGSLVNYRLTMEFNINYSTFTGTTLPMSFVQVKDYTGNIPNDNWVNGYIYMPIIGRLDNNDPTVVDCKINLKIEKQ